MYKKNPIPNSQPVHQTLPAYGHNTVNPIYKVYYYYAALYSYILYVPESSSTKTLHTRNKIFMCMYTYRNLYVYIHRNFCAPHSIYTSSAMYYIQMITIKGFCGARKSAQARPRTMTVRLVNDVVGFSPRFPGSPPHPS